MTEYMFLILFQFIDNFISSYNYFNIIILLLVIELQPFNIVTKDESIRSN